MAMVVFLPTIFLPFICAGLYQIFVLLFSFAAGHLTMWRQSAPRNSLEAGARG
jgi:hypothetical protein